MNATWRRCSVFAFGVIWAGCRAQQPPSAPEAPPPATAPASPAGAAPAQDVSFVSSSVVVNACPDARKMSGRAAREAIRRLVDPCAKVPGGSAHFSATFRPDGTISLAGPRGAPDDGVVPTCVVRYQLRHRVVLRRPCRFDVQLVERTGEEPAGGHAPDASGPL
jgi:hypothetical protein